MNRMIKLGRNIVNLLLLAFLLGLFALPISSITLMTVQTNSPVLSVTDHKNDQPELPEAKEITQSSQDLLDPLSE